ncbi:MAG: murein biosynthesis integral membrane protein MurJ [Candidatus Berkelbacteria bacterium]|nr:murein biosynthesis integral membrane protein MurJ [Candidatus Berkelbacteria bacterium]
MFSALKGFFVKENSVKGASVILIVTLAVSNVLGVIRDHFLAQKIPTDRLDVYFASFRLPDLIFNVLILGSVAAAFVPVYSATLKKEGQERATRLARAALTTALIAVASSLIVLFFLMPYLMRYLVPDFNEFKRQETVELARWLLLSPFFFTISYFIGGVLNSHKRFLVYSIAPLIYNLAIILAVLLFADGFGVKGVAIGVIVGAFLHMFIQLLASAKLGFTFLPVFDFKDSGVRKIIRLMVPRAIGLGANQILLLAFTVLASAIPGGIALYTFADNIQTVPSVIFGTSFATAVFPTLAGLSLSMKGEKEQFERFFLKATRAILFFSIPSMAVLILLRAQIVRLILGYGFFGWSDTRVASAALGFFALSLVAQSLIPLLARSFYAMHDTKTPMTASIVSIVVSIVLGYFFSRSTSELGIGGLALAFSIGSWLNFFILGYLFQKRVSPDYAEAADFLVKVVIITLLASVVAQLAKDWIGEVYGLERVRYVLLQTGVALVSGAIVYLGGSWLFRIREIKS